MPVKIFCCYARKDKSFLDELKVHFMPLQRLGRITLWADTDINAGDEWENEIHKHLEAADIILLLVSPDFMASDYCYSIEMQRAIERHQKGEACVIPVILRRVHWEETPLGKLQALPTDAKPVTDISWSSRDNAFYDIAAGVRKTIEQLATKSTFEQIPTSSKTKKQPTSQYSASFGTSSKQQYIIEKANSSKPNQSKSLSSLPSSALYRLGQWIVQEKHFLLITCALEVIFIISSFFLSPYSSISDIAIFTASGIFIFSLVESALLQQWYWFAGILLLNPLIGFIYYQNDSASISVRWYWFIGSMILCPLSGVVYSLSNPKKRRSLSNTDFNQVILTSSFIGIIVFIIAATLHLTLIIYIGADIYAVGYILALIQITRLNHWSWIEENAASMILIFPVVLLAILYVVFGPKSEED